MHITEYCHSVRTHIFWENSWRNWQKSWNKLEFFDPLQRFLMFSHPINHRGSDNHLIFNFDWIMKVLLFKQINLMLRLINYFGRYNLPLWGINNIFSKTGFFFFILFSLVKRFTTLFITTFRIHHFRIILSALITSETIHEDTDRNIDAN